VNISLFKRRLRKRRQHNENCIENTKKLASQTMAVPFCPFAESAITDFTKNLSQLHRTESMQFCVAQLAHSSNRLGGCAH
jgi:hypothetical protein